MGVDRALPLGLIAGQDRLPIEVAQALRAQGRTVHAVGFQGFTDPELGRWVDSLEWVYVGQIALLLEGLARCRVRDVVVVGGIPKRNLFANSSLVRPDARALALLGALRDKGDDAILRALGGTLDEAGLRVWAQDEIAPELLAPPGAFGAIEPTPSQRDDIAFAWPLAKALGRLDIGQTIVVRERTVLAVEAMEGTDAAIRRGAELAGGAVSAIKVLKPNQDSRFDFPTIGAQTGASLAAAGAQLLAVEAGRCFVVERERLLELAEAAGICLYGVTASDLEA